MFRLILSHPLVGISEKYPEYPGRTQLLNLILAW
jgi:hypothetical protein